MAGFTSFASTAMQLLSVANGLAGTAERYNDQTGIRQYEKNKLELQGLAQKTALEKEQNKQRLAQDEAERQNRLRTAVAKQKVLFGSSGVGSGAGSSQAYLLGMAENSEEEGRVLSEAATLRNRILDQEYANKKSINMLEATQIKQKQKLNGVTALYNGLSSIF